MNGAHTFQRIGAYLIDLVIISIIAVLLTFWIPKSKEYNDALKKEENLMSDYKNGTITDSQFVDEMYETKYIEEKERITESLILVVLSMGYYAAFAYYNKGQTLGKKAMHIRIVTKDGKEPSYLRLMSRALIHNGCFTSTLSIILLLFIKSNQFSYTVGLVEMLQSVILITSTIMIICRKDKKGLHDLICGTWVIE